jgi:two-component system cell cycle sensor histidine kinase/response regulator CckA
MGGPFPVGFHCFIPAGMDTQPPPQLRLFASPIWWAFAAALVAVIQFPFPISLGPKWLLAGPLIIPLLAGMFARGRGVAGAAAGTILAGLIVGLPVSWIVAGVLFALVEGLIATFALRNGWPLIRTLDSPRDIVAMAAIILGGSTGRIVVALGCGFVLDSNPFSAALGAASLSWFSSLIAVPACLIWSERRFDRSISITSFFEAIPVVVAVFFLNLIFASNGLTITDSVPIPIVTVLVLLASWIALRFETTGIASLVLFSIMEIVGASVLKGTWRPFFPLETPALTQQALMLLMGLVIVVLLLIASVARARRRQDKETMLLVAALRQKAYKLAALNNLLAVQTGKAEGQAAILLSQNDVVEKANRQLAEQKAWMDAVLSSMPVGVYVIDREERQLDRSHRTSLSPEVDDRLPQFSLSDIAESFSVSHQDGSPLPLERWPIIRAVRTGERVVGEYIKLRQQDGTWQTLSVNAAPIRDDAGVITGAVAVTSDVTERERINEQLRESDERLRYALSAARTIAWEREAEGKMLRRTSSVAEWLGLPIETGFDDLDTFSQHVHPDDRTDASRYFYSMIRRPGEFALEYRMVRADGSIIWVVTRGKVLGDASGKPVRIVGVHLDVTAQKEAEQKLRLLESAVVHARDAIVLLDAVATPNAGRSVLYVNDAFCKMSGYTREEVVGRSLNVLRGPESDPDTLDELRTALDTGQSLQAELLNYRKNGTAYWAELTLELVRDTSGRMSHWVMIQRDITDRKRAEDALRRSEEMFRGIFENAWAGVSLIDASGQFVSVNPAFTAMLGATESDILTMHAKDVTHPDSWLVQKPYFDDVHAGLRDRFQIRKQYVRKDGSTFLGELFFNAIRGPGGEFLYGLGVTVDVTERAKLEEQLRTSEARLRAVYENTAAGFLVVDPNSVILEVNPAFAHMLGYEPSELMGTDVGNLTHPDDAANERAALDDLIDGTRVDIQVRKRYFRKDGSIVVADLYTQAVHGLDRKLLFRIGVAIDVTERVKLEDQLRQAQKMEAIGQMAGGIAHDFNNLLTAVLGNLALVRVPEGDPNQPLLLAAEQAAGRAADLTRKLLGYARRSQLVLAPVRPSDVATEVIAILRRTLDPRIVIHEDVDNCPPVIGDATLLNQVLFNLCLNSRDAMPDGGRITISVKAIEHAVPPADVRPGGFVNISVTDDGHGISPEIRSRIFEPFFTTKGVGKGTGLGLAMVLGIVQQHGGWVDCVSAPGIGTRFDLFLPLATNEGPIVPRLGPVLPPPAGGHPDDTPVEIPLPSRRETILLVDDESLIRALAKAVLEGGGYHVIEAEDGLAAVDWVREHPHTAGLIIMDLTMPRMSGRDAFREIQTINPHVKVLFSSGYSAEELSDVSGAVGLLAKPYRPVDLIATVHAILSDDGSLRSSEERGELSNLRE